MNNIESYYGRVPACGVFCGGCPTYTRDKIRCPGADENIKRCEGCKTFHLCCKEKGIIHCYECKDFPCKRFKDFSYLESEVIEKLTESGIKTTVQLYDRIATSVEVDQSAIHRAEVLGTHIL